MKVQPGIRRGGDGELVMVNSSQYTTRADVCAGIQMLQKKTVVVR